MSAPMPLSTAFPAYHPSMGAVQATADYLPEHADGQVESTVTRMAGYALQDATSDVVQSVAAGLCVPGNEPATVQAVWQHAKANIKFELDQATAAAAGLPNHTDVAEVLVRPADMAGMIVSRGKGVGDCDDYTMYVCSLLTACGIPCRIVTIAAKDSPQPENYSHVYACAYPADPQTGIRSRTPVDASHGPHCGWEAPEAALTRKQEYSLGAASAGLHSPLVLAAAVAGAGLLAWHMSPAVRVWVRRQTWLMKFLPLGELFT